MNATNISFGFFIVLLTILLARWMRKLTPHIVGGSVTKDVPLLRIDHVTIEAQLLGVWQALYSGDVLNFKEVI